jgi:hypothetical protein
MPSYFGSLRKRSRQRPGRMRARLRYTRKVRHWSWNSNAERIDQEAAGWYAHVGAGNHRLALHLLWFTLLYVSLMQVTCPVHVIGPVVNRCKPGQALFEGITAASALAVLREWLMEIGVEDARAYRTHDLRRGHALDLQLSGSPLPIFQEGGSGRMCWSDFVAGAPLVEVLRAGEWSSPAFMEYLDLHRLERDAVIQAHADESESENES